MDYMRNNPSGPRKKPTRQTSSPRHDNDIKVGEYYYGVNCPVCHKTSNFITLVNTNLIGGRIEEIAMDAKYESHRVRQQEYSRQMPENATGSFHRGGVNATPTWFWADGLATVGGPYDPETGEINQVEMAEYLCVRAAKCYLKEVNPHWPDERVHQTASQFFESPLAEKHHKNGDTSRDPYSALREISIRHG